MTKVDYKNGKGILSGDHFAEIREYFSIENPAAKYNYGKQWHIPKRLYAITPTGQFKIGLSFEIQAFLDKKSYKSLVYSKEAESVLFPKLNKPLIQRLSKEYRYYQSESIQKVMDNGRGILLLGTGAGKTLICAGIIDNYYLYSKSLKDFKCLIIVPNVGLALQTYKDFSEYGVSFTYTVWTGNDKPDLNANVVIANTDILRNRIFTNKWVYDVDLLIVDECHILKSRSEVTKLVSSIKTPNKIGLTGTLPESLIDIWTVYGLIGPVINSKNSAELREEKFLTNASIKILKIDYLNKPVRIKSENKLDNYMIELDYLMSNNFRNDVIKRISGNFKNNLLILINNLDHGDILFNLLSKIEGKQVFFIRGEVEAEEREKVKEIMENNNNVICIAISAIFAVGINIKNIHGIIFAAGGKSFVRVVQSIGRGLRLNENKDKLLIIDIMDMLHYGTKHGEVRKEIYTKESLEYTETSIKEDKK